MSVAAAVARRGRHRRRRAAGARRRRHQAVAGPAGRAQPRRPARRDGAASPAAAAAELAAAVARPLQRVQGRARAAGDRAGLRHARPTGGRSMTAAIGQRRSPGWTGRPRSPAPRATPAEIALPGPGLRRDRRRHDRQRPGQRDRRRARPSAPTACCAVLTHHNLPKVAASRRCCRRWSAARRPARRFFPMQDDVVHYAGQPVALVVAESLEQAQYAATLVRVSYAADAVGHHHRSGARSRPTRRSGCSAG